MSNHNHAQGLVGRLGRLVRSRVREFVGEARQQLDSTLRSVRDDLDQEMADSPDAPQQGQPPVAKGD